MNKITLRLLFLFLLTTIGLVSCDTESVDPNLLDDDGPDTELPAAFQVDFSGQTYVASTTTATIINNTITIFATRASDGATVSITVPATATGTYTATVMAYDPGPLASNQYTNVSSSGITGSVTISAINSTTHTLTGTFNFVGSWSDTAANLPTVAFTNGIFTSIPYTTTTNPVGNPLFKLDFDGTTFTADDYYATVGIGLIDIGGVRGSNGEYVSFFIYGTTPGTYTNEQVDAEYYSGGDEDNFYTFNNAYGTGTSATVTITNIDTVNHTVSGTFSFVGWGSGVGTGASVDGTNKSFTNGVFENIPYETTDPGGDEFTATVDGTPLDYVNSISETSTEIYFIGVGPNHRIKVTANSSEGSGTFAVQGAATPGHTIVYTDANGTEYNVTEGTMTVEIGTMWMEGTCSFVVKNDAGEVIHTVTDGHFNIEYAEE